MSDTIAVDSPADPINQEPTVVEGVNDGNQKETVAPEQSEQKAPVTGILGDAQNLGDQPQQPAPETVKETQVQEGGALPEGWKDGISKEIFEKYPNLKDKLPGNINTMVKMIGDLDHQRGQKTVSPIPNKDLDPNGYKKFLSDNNLGGPEKAEDYSNEAFEAPENIKQYFKGMDDRRSSFRNDCFELDVSKQTHAELEKRFMDRQVEEIGKTIEIEAQAKENKTVEIKEQLQRTLGMGYDPYIRSVQKSIGYLQRQPGIEFDVYQVYAQDEKFHPIMAEFSKFISEDQGAPQGGFHNMNRSAEGERSAFMKENKDAIYGNNAKGIKRDDHIAAQYAELNRIASNEKRNPRR